MGWRGGGGWEDSENIWAGCEAGTLKTPPIHIISLKINRQLTWELYAKIYLQFDYVCGEIRLKPLFLSKLQINGLLI